MDNNIYNSTLKKQSQALALIKAGLRTPLVHSLTGVPLRALRNQWKEIHGNEVLPGRLPMTVLSNLEKGQSPITLATAVATFFALEKRNKDIPAAFLECWDIAKTFSIDTDINTVWYAIRDVKAGIVLWVECEECSAHYIKGDHKTTCACPFCGGVGHKYIKAAA